MFIFHNVTITHPENFTQCTTRGSFVTHWQETAYNMFTFCCLFLLPLVIMIVCYSRIFIRISRKMARESPSSREVHLRCSKNNIPKARMRTLKMSVVIVICFIVCWTPYYLLGLWYWFFPDDLEGKVSHSLTHMLFTFGLFSACLDPVVYGLFTIRFQRGLTRYCRRAAATSDPAATGPLECPAAAPPTERHAAAVSANGGDGKSPSSSGVTDVSETGRETCHFSAESSI